jgi:hypothetical protein
MNWEEDLVNDFDNKFVDRISGDMWQSTSREDIKKFIHSLLKQQRDKYYYHIENSVSTKEADYIDRMVNPESTMEKK